MMYHPDLIVTRNFGQGSHIPTTKRAFRMPDRKISIYEPNKPGWPYIVVVRRLGEYEMTAVKTRKEARELAVAKRPPSQLDSAGKERD